MKKTKDLKVQKLPKKEIADELAIIVQALNKGYFVTGIDGRKLVFAVGEQKSIRVFFLTVNGMVLAANQEDKSDHTVRRALAEAADILEGIGTSVSKRALKFMQFSANKKLLSITTDTKAFVFAISAIQMVAV